MVACPFWGREIEGSNPSVLKRKVAHVKSAYLLISVFAFLCALSLMDRVVVF